MPRALNATSPRLTAEHASSAWHDIAVLYINEWQSTGAGKLLEAAADAFDAALSAFPSPALYEDRGLVAVQLERWALARKSFKAARAAGHDSAKLRNGMAAVYAAEGDLKKARKELKYVVRFFGDDGARENLARLPKT